jgi:hypothetical protein
MKYNEIKYNTENLQSEEAIKNEDAYQENSLVFVSTRNGRHS